MHLQVLSDLHLETEAFEPEPAPCAELLVLAGDIDSTWVGLECFKSWPVQVILVAGNHEFDGREMSTAWPELRERCECLGIRLLERECIVLTDADGRRIRFVATTRWTDFNLFGPAHQAKAQRAGHYFVRIMRATQNGAMFDAAAVREEALACRTWLKDELTSPPKTWDATVVITHFGPSFRSADPRYGEHLGTASFCNADDDLLQYADLWIHGHLHCRHDYVVPHEHGVTRVVCNARGHFHKGETQGYDGGLILRV